MPRYVSDDTANIEATILGIVGTTPDSGGTGLTNPDSGDPGTTNPGTSDPGGVTTNESVWLTAGATLDMSDGWPFKVSYPGMTSADAHPGGIWGSGYTNLSSSSSSSTDHDVTDVTGWISNDPHLFGSSTLPTDSGLPVTNPPSTLPTDSGSTLPTTPTTPFVDSHPPFSTLPTDPGLTPPTGTPFVDSNPPSGGQPIEYPWRNADGIVNTNWHPQSGSVTGATPPDSVGAGQSTQVASDHAGGYHFGDWHLI
ncbi:MAG: hypothetical protein AB7K64_01265 [Variibacter sp.]